MCRSGGIGRHARLKIWWEQSRVGSSPTFGTIADNLFQLVSYFLIFILKNSVKINPKYFIMAKIIA